MPESPTDPLRAAVERLRDAYDEAPHRWRAWAIGIVVALGLCAFAGYEYVRIEHDATRLFSNTLFLLYDGQVAEAERQISQLMRHYRLSSWARSRTAHFFAGEVALAQHRYADAEGRFRAYLDAWGRKPLDDEARLGLAQALEGLGRLDEAEAEYARVLSEHPDSHRAPEARLGLARLLAERGRPEEARAHLEAVASDTSTFLHQVARTELRALAGGG